jgi:hypothetical protein
LNVTFFLHYESHCRFYFVVMKELRHSATVDPLDSKFSRGPKYRPDLIFNLILIAHTSNVTSVKLNVRDVLTDVKI